MKHFKLIILLLTIWLWPLASEIYTNVFLFDTIKSIKDNTNVHINRITRKYSESELNKFLDSVGQIDQTILQKKITWYVDSVYSATKDLNISFSLSDFQILKTAVRKKRLDLKTAKLLFPFPIDTTFVINDSVYIGLYSFDKKETNFNEFAIMVGFPTWESDLYFFKKNHLISYHHTFHRYGLDLQYFKDSDGKTVVYYLENFGSGTGVLQFNYFFYKYIDLKLKPVLNILENGILDMGPDYRKFCFKSTILKTKPLTFKFVYNYNLPDNNWGWDSIPFQNDSTNITFSWNNNKNLYQGNFNNKLQLEDIFSFYPSMLSVSDVNLELYSIHLNYKKYKAIIQSKDTNKRNRVLFYLANIFEEIQRRG